MSTDEFGVLALAAFFTGENWSSLVSSIGYYGYGQALLYVPLFKLIHNPTTLYTSIIILNSILISLIPIFIINILERCFKEKNKTRIFLITITVSVYPHYLIYSKWSCNEILMALIPWICIYILVKEEENVSNIFKKNTNSILLAGVLTYGYATHGRFIGIITATIITIVVYQLLTKRKIVSYIYFVPSLVLGLILDNNIKNYLLSSLWLKDSSSKTSNTLSTEIREISSIDYNAILPMLKSFVGQLFYVSSSTFGFFIISLSLCITLIINFFKNYKFKIVNENGRGIFIISFFSSLSFLIGIFISVIFLKSGVMDPNGRGDYFIYGRYIDNLVGPIIFIGLYKIRDIKNRLIYISLLIFFVIFPLTLFWISRDIIARPNISNWTILDILPYINNNINNIDFISNISFLRLTIIVLVVFVFLLCFIKMKRVAMNCVILSLLFLYTYLYVSSNMIIPNSNRNYSQVTSAIKIFDELGTLYEEYPNITLVTDNKVKPWSESRYQFVLPQYKISLYKGEWDSIPDGIEMNSIIMSPYNLNLEEKKADIYKIFLPGISDVFLDENVWIYGKNIKSYLDEKLIQTASKENNKFDSIIPLKEFSSQNDQNGHIKNKNSQNLISNGQSGFLMYGPYMTLEKGKYRLSIDAQLIKSTQSELGFVDVVSNGGKTIHKKVFLDKQMLDKNNIYLEFYLNDDIRDLEIRVYTNFDVILDVNSVKILNNLSI